MNKQQYKELNAMMKFLKGLCCFCCRSIWHLFVLALFGITVVVPAIGLVWWFVEKPPVEFMITCIGISVLWFSFGIMAFLVLYGWSKYRTLCPNGVCPSGK